MRVLRGSYKTWEPGPSPAAVTVGVLDGVHRGHRALIAHLDPALERTVLTFEPHPVEVLRPGTHPRLITTLEERVDLFEQVGVDTTGVLDLAEIRFLDPEVFVEEALVGVLGVRQVVAGPDFRFGRDRTGDVALLRRLGDRHGYEVTEIEEVVDGQAPVSSSRIRGLIEMGEVEAAAEALGSLFRVTGEVVDGDRRGGRIGFPTANLEPPPRKVIPATGVYAGHAIATGTRYLAAINVGVRPTFGDGDLVIEAHLLDFDGDLYGQTIAIEFARFLRPELAFDRVDPLVAQIERDVSQTRALLGA